MINKEILQKALTLIKNGEWLYICNAIESFTNNEERAFLINYLSEPKNVPKRFRGKKWRGSTVIGLWSWDGKLERVRYLKYLIKTI